jgi:asparagine synthase (glutamine-hydrolysing)
MRRALVGIVPNEVLNRKRKAFVARAPIAAISTEWAGLIALDRSMVSDSLGFVDSTAFLEAMQQARGGQAAHIVALMRTLAVEFWLRNLVDSNLLHLATPAGCDAQFRKEKAKML